MEFQAGGLFMAAVQVMPEAGDRSLGARHSSRGVWTLLREDQLRALLLAVSALEPAIQLALPGNHTSPSPPSQNSVLISAGFWNVLVRMLMPRLAPSE